MWKENVTLLALSPKKPLYYLKPKTYNHSIQRDKTACCDNYFFQCVKRFESYLKRHTSSLKCFEFFLNFYFDIIMNLRSAWLRWFLLNNNCRRITIAHSSSLPQWDMSPLLFSCMIILRKLSWLHENATPTGGTTSRYRSRVILPKIT